MPDTPQQLFFSTCLPGWVKRFLLLWLLLLLPVCLPVGLVPATSMEILAFVTRVIVVAALLVCPLFAALGAAAWMLYQRDQSRRCCFLQPHRQSADVRRASQAKV